MPSQDASGRPGLRYDSLSVVVFFFNAPKASEASFVHTEIPPKAADPRSDANIPTDGCGQTFQVHMRDWDF